MSPLPTFEKARKIRLVALDLDGTTLNSQRELDPEVVEAVYRGRDAGLNFALASGRTLPSMTPYAKSLGIESGFVCANGCHVALSPDQDVLLVHLARRPVEAVLAMADKLDLHVNAYTRDELLFARNTEWGDLYKRRLRSMTPRVASHEEILASRVTKVMIVTDPDRVPGFRESLEESLDPNEAAIVESEPEYLELLNPAAGKGEGLRALTSALNVSSEETAAIGDYLNDVSMLRWAGFSAAVENAHEAVKASVDYVVPSNVDHGVVQFIDSILESKRE